MSNTADNNQSQEEPDWMTDMDGNVIEVSSRGGVIQLFGWRITEDSLGRPYQSSVDTLNLTPRQGIALARRLFNAATE